MYSSLLFLAAATAFQLVSAQTVTPPANTPQCLLACAAVSCPTSELTCICVDQINAITSCVLANCSTTDQATAAQDASVICANVSSSASASGSAPATSSGTEVASSSAAESSSAASHTSQAAASSASTPASTAAASTVTPSASPSATGKSDATHNSAMGLGFLGVAGIAIGFALL